MGGSSAKRKQPSQIRNCKSTSPAIPGLPVILSAIRKLRPSISKFFPTTRRVYVCDFGPDGLPSLADVKQLNCSNLEQIHPGRPLSRKIRYSLDWLGKLAFLEFHQWPKAVAYIRSVMNHSNIAVSAGAMVVRSGDGQTFRWGPKGTLRIIAGASTTDRSFSIVESTEPPGSGAPLHVHHGEAEAFYILDGTVQLTCGNETVTAHAGDFVYTPRDVPHKFVVAGHKPARMLLLFSRPGFERFFVEGGSPLDQPPADPPNPDAFRQLVEKYDMELLEMPAH